MAVKDASRVSRVSGFADSVVAVEDAAVTHYDVVLEAVGGMSSAPISLPPTVVMSVWALSVAMTPD
jgi:hypothetical protein